MLSLGIDAVDIERFSQWHTFTHKKLQRVFTRSEIDYCLSNPKKSAERFAVRFAAKEAFYKAIIPLLKEPLPLLYVCIHCEIKKTDTGTPVFFIQWEKFSLGNAHQATVSLTHTRTTALACVIVVAYSTESSF